MPKSGRTSRTSSNTSSGERTQEEPFQRSCLGFTPLARGVGDQDGAGEAAERGFHRPR